MSPLFIDKQRHPCTATLQVSVRKADRLHISDQQFNMKRKRTLFLFGIEVNERNLLIVPKLVVKFSQTCNCTASSICSVKRNRTAGFTGKTKNN